jgi:hypothetical protein
MGYPGQPRLKIYGRADLIDVRDQPWAADALTVPGNHRTSRDRHGRHLRLELPPAHHFPLHQHGAARARRPTARTPTPAGRDRSRCLRPARRRTVNHTPGDHGLLLPPAWLTVGIIWARPDLVALARSGTDCHERNPCTQARIRRSKPEHLPGTEHGLVTVWKETAPAHGVAGRTFTRMSQVPKLPAAPCAGHPVTCAPASDQHDPCHSAERRVGAPLRGLALITRGGPHRLAHGFPCAGSVPSSCCW